MTRVPCCTETAANLTLSVDDEVLKKARIRALEQGTSVNAILAERLRAFAREGEAQASATESLITLAKKSGRPGGKARSKQRIGRRYSRFALEIRKVTPIVITLDVSDNLNNNYQYAPAANAGGSQVTYQIRLRMIDWDGATETSFGVGWSSGSAP